MRPSERIAAAAWRAVAGQIDTPSEPGLCLRAVRLVVEHALNLAAGEMYSRWATLTADPVAHRADDIWARDLEKSFRDAQGWALSGDRARPGDLLFNWRAAWSDRWGAYVGHVGILVSHDLVWESVNPAYRPHALHRGALCLTPRRAWGEPTTVIRIPEGALD